VSLRVGVRIANGSFRALGNISEAGALSTFTRFAFLSHKFAALDRAAVPVAGVFQQYFISSAHGFTLLVFWIASGVFYFGRRWVLIPKALKNDPICVGRDFLLA